MPLQNPFAEEPLIFVERQIPVLGLSQYGCAAAYCRFGINQIGSVQRSAACLALVAVCMLVLAVGACTRYITVGKELSRFSVVILFGGLFDKYPFVV